MPYAASRYDSKVRRLLHYFRPGLAAGAAGVVLLLSGGVASCGCAEKSAQLTPLAPGAAALPAGFRVSAPWSGGVTHRIIQAYGIGDHVGVDRPNRSNDAYALDFDLGDAEPVLAVADGRVAFAGEAAGGWRSYGNIVVIAHEAGISSLYAHLSSVTVAAGNTVRRGDAVGTAGSSGGVRTHLHLALYEGAKLAVGKSGTGPYGGSAVRPEPFSDGASLGLARGQCVTASQEQRPS